MSTLTYTEAARLIRVSERYLREVIVVRGELTPVDDDAFNEAEVLAYRVMDTKRRKDALKAMVAEDEQLN